LQKEQLYMNECTECGKRVAITAHACRYYSAQRYFWWGDPKLEHINIKTGWTCAFVIFTMLIVFVENIR